MIFFTDIAGFSRLPMERQSVVIQGLNGEITHELRDLLLPPDGQPRVIALPTGDGAAMTFLGGNPGATPEFERVLRIAIRLMHWAYENDTSLRIGVNDGQVSLVTDINGRANVCGDTINLAQRVMDAANPGQMLISESWFRQYVGDVDPSKELMCGRISYRFEFAGPFELAAKHGRRITVYKAVLRPVGGNGDARREYPWWSNADPMVQPEAGRPKSKPLQAEGVTREATVAPNNTLKSLSDLPTAIFEKLSKAFDLRSAASEAAEPEAADRFKEAAKAFHKITEDEADYLRSKTRPAKPLHYWLLMERAFCLLRRGDEDDLEQAARIYEQVEALYPDSAVALFRHGQVLSYRGQIPDAIEKLQASIIILDAQREQADSDEPPVHAVDDRHWVHATVRRILGYTCWLRSKARPDNEEGRQKRLQDMKDAIKWTHAAVGPVAEQAEDSEAERAKIVNNLVYYSWAERQARPEADTYALLEADFNRYVAQLEDTCSLATTTDYGPWDTLCRALEWTGDIAGAKAAAVKVKESLQRKVERQTGDDLSASGAQADDWMGMAVSKLLAPEVDALLYAAKVLMRS